MKICSIALALFLLPVGCTASRPAGRASLNALRGGMTMEEVIRELGEPTAVIELQVSGLVYHDMSYVDTIIDSGVVELYFRPNLTEIRLNTELYREY